MTPLHRTLAATAAALLLTGATAAPAAAARAGYATGTITVTGFAEDPFAPADASGLTLKHLTITETFAGDVTGPGTAGFLQVLAADGTATFTGAERVTGTLAGRAGSFVLESTGTQDADGTVHGRWHVRPGSATGALAGLSGRGGFTAAAGQGAEWTLRYTLPR